MAIAGLLQPEIGQEDFLEYALGNTRSSIADDNYVGPAFLPQLEAGWCCVLKRVFHQVGDRPFEGEGLPLVYGVGRPLVKELDLTISVLIDNRHQHQRQIEMGRGLGHSTIAKESERAVHHGLHFIDVPKMPGLLFSVVNQLTAQPHPRERGAQVVRDSRQHQGSMREEPLYLSLHLVERSDNLPQLAWTRF